MRRETSQFRLEHQMQCGLETQLLASFESFAEQKAIYCLRRPVIGGAVPDLLLCWSENEIKVPKRHLSNLEAHVLAFLCECGPLSFEAVVEKLFLHELSAARALARLKDCEIIVKKDNNRYSVVDDSFFRDVSIVAFELKLKRWRTAMQQAIMYRRFANYSTVVLDASTVHMTSENVATFSESKIGLLLYDGNQLTELAKPTLGVPITAERVQAVQKLARAGTSFYFRSRFSSPRISSNFQKP